MHCNLEALTYDSTRNTWAITRFPGNQKEWQLAAPQANEFLLQIKQSPNNVFNLLTRKNKYINNRLHSFEQQLCR
jgi:hypothetical protein